MKNATPLRSVRRRPVAHYVALLLPTEMGGWRALFPDIAECEARAFTLQDATYAAAMALARCAKMKAAMPRSLLQTESDRDWFKANGIVPSERS